MLYSTPYCLVKKKKTMIPRKLFDASGDDPFSSSERIDPEKAGLPEPVPNREITASNRCQLLVSRQIPTSPQLPDPLTERAFHAQALCQSFVKDHQRHPFHELGFTSNSQ
jgi:hypothetical protein